MMPTVPSREHTQRNGKLAKAKKSLMDAPKCSKALEAKPASLTPTTITDQVTITKMTQIHVATSLYPKRPQSPTQTQPASSSTPTAITNQVAITKMTKLHQATSPYPNRPKPPTEPLLTATEPTQANGDWYNKNRAGIPKTTAMAEAAGETVAKQPNQEEEEWQAGYDLK